MTAGAEGQERKMKLVAAGMSHPGKVRAHNEDSYLVANQLGIFAVADGVESEAAGEIASKMAVEQLEKIIRELDLDQDATPPFEYAEGIPLPARALKFAFRQANRAIFERAGQDKGLAGMATTLTATWFRSGRVFIANVGDSRAYMIRSGRILQLTHDHTSLAQGNAARTVFIDDIQDFSSASEHELTRALGINPDLEVQLAGGTPKPGDIFLLCTDGFYDGLRDFEIMENIKAQPPDLCAKTLLNLALKRSGNDNICVVVIQVA
jgi:PPM family protein phosphatase